MSMMSLALMDDKEKARAEADKEMEKANSKTEAMKDSIVLVKAKLIHMRRRLAVADVQDFIRSDKR